MEKGRWSGGALTSEAGNDEMKVQRPEKTENEDTQEAQDGVVGAPLGVQGFVNGALQAGEDETEQNADTVMKGGQSQGLAASEGGEALQTLAQESLPMGQAQPAGNAGMKVTGVQEAGLQAATEQDGVAIRNTAPEVLGGAGAQSAGVIASGVSSDAGGAPSMRSERAVNPFADQLVMLSGANPRGDIILQPGGEKKSLKLSMPLIFGMVGVGVVLVVLALVFSMGGKSKVDALTAFNDFRNYLENGPADDEVLIAPPEETAEDGAETEGEGESQVVGETVGQLEDLDRSNGKWFFEAIGESDASEDFVNRYYENLEAKYKVFQEAVEAGNYQVEDKDAFLEGVGGLGSVFPVTMDFLTFTEISDRLSEIFYKEGMDAANTYIDNMSVSDEQNVAALWALDKLKDSFRREVELLAIYNEMGCGISAQDDEGEEAVGRRNNHYNETCVAEAVEEGRDARLTEWQITTEANSPYYEDVLERAQEIIFSNCRQNVEQINAFLGRDGDSSGNNEGDE